MKNKELSDLVTERSSLLENIQNRNEKLETLSLENKKYEIDMFEMKRNIEKLNNRLNELSSLLIAAEEKDKTNKVKIENLGKKLIKLFKESFRKLVNINQSFLKN